MSPKVILLYGGKGGIGKTTIATNLAWTLADAGKTALTDADYQKSTLKLSSGLTVPAPYDVVPAESDADLSDYEYVVVDMPPSIMEARAMLDSATLIVVPFTLRELDIQALTTTLMTDLRGLPRVVVMSRVTHAQTSAARTVRGVLTGLDLTVLTTVLREYSSAHDRAARDGVPVIHPDAQGRSVEHARSDMIAATAEIRDLIGAM